MLDASPQPASDPTLHPAPLRATSGATPAKLSRKAQAAWRRAVDELLIDAIFGPGPDWPGAVRPVPVRVRSAL